MKHCCMCEKTGESGFVVYCDDCFDEIDAEIEKHEQGNWKERGDILFDENQHLYKQYNELADRLRKSQEDNERLCKILIELGFGNRIEVE